MSKSFDFLLSDTPEVYKTLILNYQFVPKVFWFCNDSEQFCFINKWDDVIKGELEYDFMKFLLNKYNANCFARGSLWVNEKEEQEIVLTFVDRDSDIGTDMIAKVSRDSENKVNSLSEYKVYSSGKSEILFGGLFNELILDETQLTTLETLYEEIKPRLGVRDLREVNKH